MKPHKSAIHHRSLKVLLLFVLLAIAVGLFLHSIYDTITSRRQLPSQTTMLIDRSLRGAIISADNYTLSQSQKIYQAVVHGASIEPGKREVLIKLFSIYSGVTEEALRQKFNDYKIKKTKGNIVLAKEINSRTAMQLKALAHKLRRMGVFRWIKNHHGMEVLYGLDIVENGESRSFPLKDVMSPILGYVHESFDGRYRQSVGKKGLEKQYEEHLNSKKNGYFKGKRDIVGAVIHDRNSLEMTRVDGLDLHLNIPLSLQKRIELMLDRTKRELNASEIIVGVMESNTGKVLSLASSERFDPGHITDRDIPALNPKFSEYLYEAGSVLKPITLSVALDHKVVKPDTWFDIQNGRLRIGKKYVITDDEIFKSLRARDIIVHSSNVGISKIAWRLSGRQFRDGLLKFGIASPSGIDLSLDLSGKLKPLYKLNHKIHRANSAYGYGMLVTFAQLFKAYSAFNNNGIAVTPRIVNYLKDPKGNHYTLKPKVGNREAISPQTAEQMHKILVEVVRRGTGKRADYPGLEIGGKTGTAHIAKKGTYASEYHSSFFGFANDDRGNRYTIGVLVIKAKNHYKYFASQSAVPTFRRVVDALVELNHLKPKDSVRKKYLPLQTETKPIATPADSTEVGERETAENRPEQTMATENRSVMELFENIF